MNDNVSIRRRDDDKAYIGADNEIARENASALEQFL